jgi:hypothetical protein
MCCRGVQRIANPPYLEGFPFPALLSVAPYCVPSGIRVVSIQASLLHDPTPSCTHPKYAQHLTRDAIIQLTLHHYSHWMPTMGRNTAEGIDEALG